MYTFKSLQEYYNTHFHIFNLKKILLLCITAISIHNANKLNK